MSRFASYCEALFQPERLNEAYIENLLERIKDDGDLQAWERLALNEYIAAYGRGTGAPPTPEDSSLEAA